MTKWAFQLDNPVYVIRLINNNNKKTNKKTSPKSQISDHRYVHQQINVYNIN